MIKSEVGTMNDELKDELLCALQFIVQRSDF